MRKDLKIGMLLGLLLVTGVVLWLSTRPGLSVKARMLKPGSEIRREAETDPNFQSIPPAETTTSTEVEQQQISEPIVSEQTENIETRTFHMVHRGETLSDISYRYYGSSGKWRKILDANRGVIKDENKLKPGTKLVIPE